MDASVSLQLVWASLSPLSSPSVSLACVHVPWLPGWPWHPRASVHLFHLTACTLCHGDYLFFFWLCQEGCVRCPSLSAPSHLGTWVRPCAARVGCTGWVCLPHHTWVPGPTLCAARVGCTAWVCRTTLGFRNLLSVWGHSP